MDDPSADDHDADLSSLVLTLIGSASVGQRRARGSAADYLGDWTCGPAAVPAAPCAARGAAKGD